jgi:Kef-type K+ transport system membrane component KefB
MNIFIFISAVFITTLLLGKLLEKIRVPWIFAALIVGTFLAIINPIESITSSSSFEFLAQVGMYLLLFLVGFELDINRLKKKSLFIFRSAFIIVVLEGLIGCLIVHYIFNYSWLISLIVSLSFATVGEAILVPILQEFKLVNTSLGQAIIGIGSADDIIEILMLLVASFVVGKQGGHEVINIIVSLMVLALLTVGFSFIRKERERFKFASIETLFLFILFVFFLFVGVGAAAEAAPLAAILAGLTVRLFVADKRLEFVENELKSLTYGFFAPLFFVWVGLDLDINYLITYPLLVLLVVVVSKGAKLLGSIMVAKSELGMKGSILLGVGLSVRFSTSIIIIKFLYNNGVIGFDIYSVVVASSIVFKFIVPILFSQLVSRWNMSSISSRKLG